MKKTILIFSLCIGLVTSALAINDSRLLRFPDVNKHLIVFVYAGDIWSVSSLGGVAQKLTSHQGLELFPKISPDGQWIAFSAEYSGSRQVYIMPIYGGIPTQLTYYNDVGLMPPRGGFDYQVLDWTPDSQNILVRANRTPYGRRRGKYFLVSINEGLEIPLQIPEAGGGTFSPDGKKIVYTPIAREFRTWKRYKGGMAQDIWMYDLEKDVSKRLTTFTGTDQHPIWFQNKIYFVSDRDLILNIYSYDLQTEKIEQITNHTEYDVLWPSGQDGLIVYENGGYLYRLDLGSGEAQRIKVNINYDSPYVLPTIKNVKENIASMDISPTGKRAVFEARGDVYTVPAEEGITYNLTKTQGIREMNPVWSPDARYISIYSDVTGEYEIYLIDRSNEGTITSLTENSQTWRFPPVWSPDSAKLLFGDRDQNLRILDIKTKKVTNIDKARRGDIRYYDWSPDSKWVVYVKFGENMQDAVWVYSLEQGQSFPVTDDIYIDFSPVFSTCGKYLFFLSDRDFNLSFSSFEFDYIYQNSTNIYAVALTESISPLFKDKNDVEEVKKSGAKKKQKTAPKTEEEKTPAVNIDFDGINRRIVSFPLEAGNYSNLAAIKDGILYVKDNELHMYNIEDKKDTVILKGITGGALSADGKKILYRAQKKIGVIDLKPDQKVGAGELDLSDLTMKIDPLKEWRQIFEDAWRIYRDWFYVKNLHGVDWDKMKEKYGQLVPYLSHRADLDFIFGELVGELNAGHCYINWGDFPKVDRIEGGLLGAELKADEKSNRYIISKIYKGENWNEETRSPLTEQGIDVKEGDYLISLNGHDIKTRDNPYRYLENTVGKKISIVVSKKPTKDGGREYWIKPIKSELSLFYLDWVNSRRKMVDRLSGGRIGYIHVPNTSIEGNRELFKGFYAFRNKDALIIDDRYNGGGFIPDVMTELLSRKILSYWGRRGILPTQTPGAAHEGPKVMLINHYAGSGGDIFPYFFKKKKLGILIGTRTWGGVVGLSGNPRLVDGGYTAVPTFGLMDTEGNWIIEGTGVEPDIEIVDRPELVAQGKDPSLEKAVEVLLEELKKNPPKKVKKSEDPDRSKWIKKDSH
ncbi:MAG: PDZ domain-containing protein [Candidatus Aminicenantes bacterium]|jgi:tricorn protease